jgi:hypothetical protein
MPIAANAIEPPLFHPQIRVETEDRLTMNTLRNALQIAAGLVVAVVSFAFMAAIGLAFLGVALVVGITTAIALKLSRPKPAPAMARDKKEPRIWNDGRGTIIDM